MMAMALGSYLLSLSCLRFWYQLDLMVAVCMVGVSAMACSFSDSEASQGGGVQNRLIGSISLIYVCTQTERSAHSLCILSLVSFSALASFWFRRKGLYARENRAEGCVLFFLLVYVWTAATL